jgi:hypothetical protein
MIRAPPTLSRGNIATQSLEDCKASGDAWRQAIGALGCDGIKEEKTIPVFLEEPLS